MPRLLVYRGETLDRERDLSQLPFRIGRAPTNDLVPEDPLKSVSREHAEIRFENGRYVLVDRQSENGIWVSGTRRPTIILDQNVVASIGPFRLKFEAGEAGAVATAPVAAADQTVISTVSPEVLAAVAAAKPTPPKAHIRATRPPTPAAKPWPKLSSQTWMITGAATVVVLITIFSVLAVMRSSRAARVAAEQQMAAWVSAATQQIEQGACSDALAQNIRPGLAQDPDNGDLAALKSRAEGCLTPRQGEPEPEVDPVLASLTRAREMITAGDCAGAIADPIGLVLAGSPDNADAIALKAEAEKCVPATNGPRPPSPPKVILAKRIAPPDGGLEPLPNETDADYQARIKAMRDRYDEAVAAAAKEANRATIQLLEGVARDASTAYLDVAFKLAEARRAYEATARTLLAEARDALAKGRWNEAITKFNRAHEIDPSQSVEAEIAQVNEAKLNAGRELCRTGKQRFNYQLPDGPTLLRQALELLPASDPCAVEARALLGTR